MREQDNRRTGGETFNIFFKPVELLLAQRAQAALLDFCHVDQPNEVNTLLVKTVPTSPHRIFAESFAVQCPAIVDVVLARHIKYILCSAVFEYLGESIELCRIRKMRYIAGVQQELGYLR